MAARSVLRLAVVLLLVGALAAPQLLPFLQLALHSQRGLGEETGVLLPAAVLGSGEVAVALRSGVYPPGQNLEASVGNKEHVYMPQGGAERAEDYELVRFREMVRES